MARLLSRTLFRHITQPSPPILPLSLHLQHRYRSSKSTPSQLFEIDLSSSSTAAATTPTSSPEEVGAGESQPSEPDSAAVLLQLEDIVHQMVLLRSTPDWLPFVPGSSFWVPPNRRPIPLPQIIDKWSNRLSHEESLSLATCRGFPSSSFYLPDDSSSEKPDVDVIVVKRETTGLVVNVQEGGGDAEEAEDEAERNVEIRVSAAKDSEEG